MPKIWADTIDTHRRQVQDAVLDATAALLHEHGPMSVTMAAIAERAGIGRATLYKYFPDVESIVLAWHASDFSDHRSHLEALINSDAVTLDDVVHFARSQRQRHRRHESGDVVGTLAHALAAEHTAMPDAVEREVVAALASLMSQLAQRKQVRSDVDADTLARWLFHAIHAPRDMSDSAVIELLKDSLAPRSAASPPRRAARRRQ
ncbi:MAG: TetR/AcrR family transcriptional regulator [Jiangellaceae bacterium]